MRPSWFGDAAGEAAAGVEAAGVEVPSEAVAAGVLTDGAADAEEELPLQAASASSVSVKTGVRYILIYEDRWLAA